MDSRAADVNRRLEEFKKAGANILIPNIELWDPSGMYLPVLEHTVLDPSPQGPDIYPADKMFRLHGHALERLGNMANIQWDPINSTVLERERGQYVLYRAVGFYQKPNGEYLSVNAMGEMDVDIIHDDLIDEYTKKANSFRDKNPQQKKEYIDYCANRDFRQKRRFLVPLAETRAKSRVIKKILNVKSQYTMAEIQQPFVTMWFTMAIDFKDPEVRRMAAQAKIQASMMIFGRPQITVSEQPSRLPMSDPEPLTSANPNDPHPMEKPPAPQPQKKTSSPAAQPPAADADDFRLKTTAQQTIYLKRLIDETGYDPAAEGLEIKQA